MNLPANLVQLLNAPPVEAPPPPRYPCSDGKPMADNSRQTYWIILLYCNLCWLFRSRRDRRRISRRSTIVAHVPPSPVSQRPRAPCARD